jgi:AraC-like DNA-binding protein
VRDAVPIAVVIVDPYAESSTGEPTPALRSFLQEFRYVPVIAALETQACYRDLLVLARWGLSEVISLDQENLSESVPQRLSAVNGWALRTALLRDVPKELPGAAVSLLAAATEVGIADGTTPALARVLGVSRRTVTRWCERAMLPPPRRLLAWMRLLYASELLDDWRRKVYQVAHSVGYASDNNFRTALNSFLEQTPKELRRSGAYRTVSGAFWDELGRLRRERRSSRGQGTVP